jgi:hypothetical protein
VQGGDIYNRMPSVALNGLDDTEARRWILSTSVDDYNGHPRDVVRRERHESPLLAPNLGRFPKSKPGLP